MRLQIDKLGKVAVTIEQGYWDINKDYDKLVIVEVKDNFATYISRKPVPAGTVLTDRKYWIPFSSLKENIVIDYNSFKAAYDERLKESENEIETINEHLTETDRAIAALQVLSKQVVELIEANRLLRQELDKTNINAKELISKTNALIKEVEQYIQSIGFTSIGEGLEIVNKTLQVKAISKEALEMLLI